MAKPVNFKFDLGDEVKDLITGIKGVIVARVEFLNGCRRYSIQPVKLKDDKTRHDEQNFDEEQLELTIQAKVVVPHVAERKASPPGGPDRAMPKRRDVPAR